MIWVFIIVAAMILLLQWLSKMSRQASSKMHDQRENAELHKKNEMFGPQVVALKDLYPDIAAKHMENELSDRI